MCASHEGGVKMPFLADKETNIGDTVEILRAKSS
jgi:hypothetical protein